jgi:hypothetical protein
MTTHTLTRRAMTLWTHPLCLAAVLAAIPLTLAACNKDESKSRTTTTKTTSTPDGAKKTTETTEKKVETEHKNPGG